MAGLGGRAVNQAASRKQEYERNVTEYDSSLDPRASCLLRASSCPPRFSLLSLFPKRRTRSTKLVDILAFRIHLYSRIYDRALLILRIYKMFCQLGYYPPAYYFLY